MDTNDWDRPDWLFAPDIPPVEDYFETGITIGADYQAARATRLFATVEYRLARSIAHFDDFSSDRRLIDSVKSELNFLRAVWGEVRHAAGSLSPASSFLRILQDCIDSEDWSHIAQLRQLAVERSRAPAGEMLEEEEFPSDEWWVTLPTAASAVPPQWQAYDLAEAIITRGLRQLHSQTNEVQSFKSNLQVLANDLAMIQEGIEVSGKRLEQVEEEVGARMREDLHPPQDANLNQQVQ